MPILNRVKEMQQQGLNEAEIAQNLKEEGFSPLDINEALEQAKIKSAIQNNPYENQTEEMQPSMIETGEQAPQPTENITEPTTETPEYIYPTPTYQQYYQEYPSANTETITEIAESLIEDKTNKLRKDTLSLQQFEVTAETRIKNIDDRLKKIEEIIDRLQASILGKIGNFGQNIESIREEMGMMQESFSKALNPLIEKAMNRQDNREEKRTEEIKAEKKGKRKSNGFEHYLR